MGTLSIRELAVRNNRGLTLFEVLVAGVVFSAGVVVLSQILTGALGAAGRAQGEKTASRLAEGLLARIEAGEIPANESDGGDFEDSSGESGYAYEVTSESGPLEGLVQVTVIVSWTDSGRTATFEVERYFRLSEEPAAGGEGE